MGQSEATPTMVLQLDLTLGLTLVEESSKKIGEHMRSPVICPSWLISDPNYLL